MPSARRQRARARATYADPPRGENKVAETTRNGFTMRSRVSHSGGRVGAGQRDQQPGDAEVVDLLDAQRRAGGLDRVTAGRAAPERVEHEPGKRPRPGVWQLGPDGLVEVVDRHRARDPDGVVVD